MMHVAPNQSPTELIRWIIQCRSAGMEIDYDTVGQVEIDGEKRDVKAAIKRQRLMDQGYICPYTLLRIDETSCHIEHIKPRAVSKAEGRREETLDYGNLVACFPAKGGDKTYGCGAPLREDKLLALSPRDPRCEVVARYQSTGRVEAAAGWELVAHTLDTLLGLNCIWLSERRKAALSGAGVSICSSNPLSAAAAKDLRETILRFRPGQKLAPFCVAIAHVAQEHIDRLEKLAAKRRFSRQGRQQDH